MRKPLFQIGEKVRYHGGLWTVIDVFWADSPDQPEAEHYRYYLSTGRHPMIHSAPEKALTRPLGKLSIVPTPESAPNGQNRGSGK